MAALYSDIIIDHYRSPRNYGSIESPDVVYEDLNPLCGDRVRIELRLSGGVVEAARFRGDGCAISIASASVLTELITGADISEVSAVSVEDLLQVLNASIKPSRLQCVRLPLSVLHSGIAIWRAK
jgi:nitrogen fixation NifU-like protein